MKNIPVMDMPVNEPDKLDPNQAVSIKISDLNALRTAVRQMRNELAKLKTDYNTEVEQFNAGYEAGEKGGLGPFADQPHFEPDYDSWRNGYYAGSYDRLIEKLTDANRMRTRLAGEVNDLLAELAALKERMRWHKWPEEKPIVGEWCEVVTSIYGFDGDLFMSNGKWVSNVDIKFWRYSDAPEPPEAENE